MQFKNLYRGGDSHMEQLGVSEILNLTPKGDQSGCGSSFLWPLKETNLGVA